MLRLDPRDMFTRVEPPQEFVLAQSLGQLDANAAVVTVNYNGTWPDNARTAFQYAVNIWQTQLTSSVPIIVDAEFRSDLGEGVLGSAGPVSFGGWSSGQPSGAFANTWYAFALQHKLAGSDLHPTQADISARFSSTFTWYYGLDGMTPNGQVDFVSVVLHELCHGLGFLGFGYIDPNTNLGYVRDTYPSVWEHFVENGAGQAILGFTDGTPELAAQLLGNSLYWNGANGISGAGGTKPRLYAPTTWSQGSSYSHLNETTYPAGNENSLMTYAIGYAEAIHNPGPITRGMFTDMGWTTSTPTCVYAVSPTSASPSAAGGSATVSVTTTAGCAWTAASNSAFITITGGATGSGAGTVTYSVAANTGAARTGTMTIAGQTVTINQASGATCAYTVSPTTVSAAAAGGSASVSVSTTTGCAWTAASNAAFLTITSGSSGSGSGTVGYTVAANTGSARSGTMTVAGQTVTVNQAAPSAAPTLTPTPTALNFGAVNAGGTLASVTPPQTVTVQQSGGTGVAWTATSNVSWATVTTADAAGTGTGAFTVTLNNTGNVLPAAGTLTGTITITAPGAQANPTIPVRVTTYAPSTSVRSFGQVDTPAQNATGVQGAIGVTGWALDDLGVAGVKIYRNCLAWENQAACQVVGGNNVVFVGDAAFLAGARPDLEAAFPTVPFRHRAGWGFLMLTNMLPHVTGQQPYGGQGPISLYVYATDQEGQLTLLGRTYVETPAQPTAITMNNDAIAKPFGAIDTPGQGVTVSGVLPNFGWVLTPDSNTVADATDILIPTNGSTMFVFLDSIATAVVAYNHCRGNVGTPPGAGVFCNDDISQIFGNPTPQPTPPPFTTRTTNNTRHRNLDAARGAIGAYNINTAAMTNGLHTIAWSVTDSAGRTEGIGSRFFIVFNTASDPTARFGATDVGLAQDRAPDRTLASLLDKPASSLGDVSALDGMRVADSAVRGRVGFDLRVPFLDVPADGAGARLVRLPELSRLELDLGPGIDAGYLVANDELRDLPAGATLLARTGTFAWAPPPGYFGTYRFVFLRGDTQLPVEVTVKPAPASAPGEAAVRMHLDGPVDGATVKSRFGIVGWALDPQAPLGAGIGAVHVWAQRVDLAGLPPVFLGDATLGLSRPDVGQAFGPAFAHAGFALDAPALAPGEYDVTAHVWNLRTARWEDARTVRVIVR